MIFVIAPAIVILTLILGGALAWLFANAEVAVKNNQTAIENKDKGYNPAVTYGYRVKTGADPQEQLKEARKESARRAAMLPRGGNNRIGRAGHSTLKTAGQQEALKEDPWTATKIAMYHGWDGVRTGAVIAPAAAPGAATAAAAAPSGKIKLVPGKDYEYIKITDDMPPAEKRKARIANAKAKSAAMKAAKAARQAGGAAPAPASAAAAAQPAAAATPAPAAATAVNIEPPQLIEITDNMSPDEVRKARIANSKAKSAFNKALKAAGVDPADVEIEGGKVVIPAGATPAATAAPAAAPAAAEAPAAPAPAADTSAALANIPKPDLIEITDDMSPDDVRKARISNSKAKSAYNKALKAAGIDPSTVSLD